MNKMNKRMKICFLVTSYPRFKDDTRGIFTYKLAEALRKYVDVKVVTIPGYKSLTSGAGILPNLNQSWKARLLFPVYWTHFFIKIIFSSTDCDIIHANWSPTAFFAILSKPFHGKKIILTERSPYLLLTKNRFWRLLNKFSFSLVERLVVISEESKDIISKDYKIKNIKVIRNGVEKIKLKKSKKSLRKELGLPLNKKIFLYVGRITEIKGIDYLIDAFKKVDSNKAILLIVGDGQDLSELKNKVKDYRINNKVIFTGLKKHQEVIKYMSASDVFILPSLGETGGNVLLEARAYGLPIISTKAGWAKEIINEGFDGYFVEQRNSEDIYNKIIYILSNKNLLNKLNKNSRKARLNSWDNCAKEYTREYKQLI